MVAINTSYELADGQGDTRVAAGRLLIAHSTADTDATAANIAQYFKNNLDTVQAYTHFAVDDQQACMVGTPGYVAWGAGAVANILAPVQIELCEFSDRTRALAAYRNYIELIRMYADKYGINKTLDDSNRNNGVKTHNWVSRNLGDTDHTDPVDYLASIGITQAQFASDIANGTGASTVVTNVPNVQPSPAPIIKKVNVTYGMRPIGLAFLPPVTNIGSGANGFAGLPTRSHDFLYIKVDHGSMKYRVKTNEDGWLPWVTKGDPNDTINGCAGVAGHAITGVQMVYITPNGEPYQQAWYRTQDAIQIGWHGVVCDDGRSVAGYTDDYAGWGTYPVDRLQIFVGTSNPY